MLTTAEMPAIGPDLAQLFVQSNFGIVTAIRIPLFPIPEVTSTFTISFHSDEDFFEGVSVLNKLRQDGTITSLLHTGNATRALMTASRFPQGIDPEHILSEAECNKILNQQSIIDFGAWASVGALYGYKNEVTLKQKRLKKALKDVAKIKFFSDGKINIIEKVLNLKWFKNLESLKFVRSSFTSLKALHQITRGQPSAIPSQNIFWRVHNFEELGLIWHAPVIPANPKACAALLDAARDVYAEHRFEMPVTLTLIDQKHMTAVFNISYDKTNSQETLRAHKAYQALSQATTQLGFLPYRCGLVSKPLNNYDFSQHLVLQKIKAALDPHNILAPGRYGIGTQF